jgi:haloalkane dehalogenase
VAMTWHPKNRTAMRRRDILTIGIAGFVSQCFAHSMAQGQSRSHSATADEDAAFIYDENRRFLDTPSGRVAYIDRGTGRVVLFLHGFPLNGFQWRGVIERLVPEQRCIAPDLLGLGYTEISGMPDLGPRAQVDMLLSFLDALRIDQVDLIANDGGGSVAQLFLAKYPKRVRTALLTNCSVEPQSTPTALLPMIELAHQDLYADLLLVPWADYKDKARSPDGLGGMCYAGAGYPTDVALEQYIRPLISSQHRKNLAQKYFLQLHENPLMGIESLLRACDVPTQIVWGMGDTMFPARNAEYLASILKRSSGIRRVDDAKVFFPEEYPDLIADAARHLWRSSEHV